MTRLDYQLADENDDAALRALLRENPMPGALSLSLEREPSFFRAAAVEGPFHQTIVGRDTVTRSVLGMGSRAVRPMFLNGVVQPVGYMSLLRADLRHPWGFSLGRAIAGGFRFYQSLHADDRAPFYLMSVVADNLPAQRLLTARLPGMPTVRAYARLYTYTIAPTRPRRPPPHAVRIERGTPQHTPALLACLDRNGARYQFFPHWTAETLFHPVHTPDLAPEHFFVALDGSNVIGCLALWDQTRFKQTVLRGYGGALARWRRLVNLAANRLGYPLLPPPGTALRYAFAGHLAVDGDDPSLFAALLGALYNEAHRLGYACFMLGLSEDHPLRPVLTRAYRHLTYASRLYLVAWEDGLDAINQVDGRPPAPEIAVM